MNRPVFAAFLALLLLAAGCQRETGGALVRLTGRIFIFNYRLAAASYMITLEKTGTVPNGSRVIATFENPAGGAALVLERPVYPKLDKIVLESPDISCVRKDKAYAVTIEVEGPDGAVLQRLDTSVTSNIDQSIMPAKPLVVGPAYDKNPEIFRNGSAIPDLSQKADCPAS